MKTIKQIADEIGVSKQAIFYRIKRPPLSNALQSLTTNKNGILTVSFDGEILIKQAFQQDTVKTFDDKKPSKTVKEPSKESSSFDGEMIRILENNLLTLQEQLTSKDNQIKEQNEIIKTQTQTIHTLSESINADRKNELAGTLIDGQQKLLAEPEPEPKPKKKGFFNFLKK